MTGRARGRSPGNRRPELTRRSGVKPSAAFVGRKGFTPVATDELLDHRLSGDELLVLLLARYTSDRDETDGFVSERQMKAVAALHDIVPAPMKKALAGLIRRGRLVKKPGGFLDVGFADVCRSAAERQKLREDWRRWKGASRSSMSGPDTTPESGPESGASPSAAPSASPSPAAAPSPDEAAAEVETNDDVPALAALWCELTGRPASRTAVAEFRSWKATFGHRVSESAMAAKMREVFQRQVARGVPPKHPRYFAGVIQDLYEHLQRNRPVVGVNEPPEPEKDLPL